MLDGQAFSRHQSYLSPKFTTPPQHLISVAASYAPSGSRALRAVRRSRPHLVAPLLSRALRQLRRSALISGNDILNSVRPGFDSTSIDPSCDEMILRLMSRPKPVPCPIGFVVKNGSKIRGRTSSGIPELLSTIRTTTREFSTLALTMISPP